MIYCCNKKSYLWFGSKYVIKEINNTFYQIVTTLWRYFKNRYFGIENAQYVFERYIILYEVEVPGLAQGPGLLGYGLKILAVLLISKH
jgi:hypothetical protein